MACEFPFTDRNYSIQEILLNKIYIPNHNCLTLKTISTFQEQGKQG